MTAVENKPAASEIGQLLETQFAVDDKDARMPGPVTMVHGVYRRSQDSGLATINGLQRISAHLSEERIALDCSRHRKTLEVERGRHIVNALPLELRADRVPKGSVHLARLGEIVHRKACAPPCGKLGSSHWQLPHQPAVCRARYRVVREILKAQANDLYYAAGPETTKSA